jgi:hypothetical protein
MAAERVWHLNFDADVELADGASWKPNTAMRARFDELAARAVGLVPDGDVLVEDANEFTDARGYSFMPTPSSRAALVVKGAEPIDAPDVSILRAVNSREACASMGDRLPGARWATSAGDVEATLASAQAGSPWRARSPWGFSGRGNIAVSGGALRENERRWVERVCTMYGGVELVPWVERLADFGLHGFVARDGVLTLGEPTVQRCSPSGTWLSTERANADDFAKDEREALVESAERCARFLHEKGYFGPFGIDAFRWRDDRKERFHALCDLNARYSMGWGVGMKDRRVDL